jgi:hypothetical protein
LSSVYQELSKDELHALFRRIGAHHITQEEVAEIADFFDRYALLVWAELSRTAFVSFVRLLLEMTRMLNRLRRPMIWRACDVVRYGAQ